MTKQKAVIVDELQKVTSHPTAVEVYEMVRKTLPRVSLGTVYRNLEMLSEKGDIQRLAIQSGKRRYDGNAATHPHICCRACGRIDDLPEGAVFNEKQFRVSNEVCGYKVTDYSIELFGICPKCRKK
jgi:Fur family ferric uptake transcriptional regulator